MCLDVMRVCATVNLMRLLGRRQAGASEALWLNLVLTLCSL
jgi:hypothetical protein